MGKKTRTNIEVLIDAACGLTPADAAENQTKIAGNVKARKEVEEIVDLCKGFCATVDQHTQARFWELLRDRCIIEVGLPPEEVVEIEPLSEKRAAAFLTELVPYGKYIGQTVKEVEREDAQYLAWLADTPDEFKLLLKRYLARSKYKGL